MSFSYHKMVSNLWKVNKNWQTVNAVLSKAPVLQYSFEESKKKKWMENNLFKATKRT